MKNLVIYDSQFGNTQKVAEVIAETVKGRAVNVKDFSQKMLAGIDLLVVGSPIQGWRPLPSITALLTSLPANSLKGIKIAAFDTRVKMFLSGDAAGKIEKRLIELGGQTAVAPGKFFVKGQQGPLFEGELAKAQVWAKKINTAAK